MAAADTNFRFAYVANQGSNNVSVIDRATNSVVTTIGGIPAPGGVAVTRDGKEVWVVADNEVDVIDTATNTVAYTFALKNDSGGIFPNSVVFGPYDYRAYVVGFAWVNTHQIWGTGSVNLATGEIHIDAYMQKAGLAQGAAERKIA
jgi:YVTN family beta-propeller protein